MNQFLFKQGCAAELELFPHISEFGVRKNNTIMLNSMPERATSCFSVYYALDGRFDLERDGKPCQLLPEELIFVLPGQKLAGANSIMNIGTLLWVDISLEKFDANGRLQLGKWSKLSKPDCMAIGKILSLTQISSPLKLSQVGVLFQQLFLELSNRELGFATRVNNLIDDLLILISRQLVNQTISRRDFPQTFTKLEQALRDNLSYQWTVEEMAAMVGLGSTAFSEKVKAYTGFSPLNYLINIRITEAIKKLKRTTLSITEIALDAGFYSSQHFATTFKKLTGYTPSDFRTRDLNDK